MCENVSENNTSKLSNERSPLVPIHRGTNSSDETSNLELLSQTTVSRWYFLSNDNSNAANQEGKVAVVHHFSSERGQTKIEDSVPNQHEYTIVPIHCRDCEDYGHLSRDCPEGFPIDGGRRRICANCCDPGHIDHNNDCPKKFCSICLEPGHPPMECQKAYRKNMTCYRCNIKGHEKQICPTLWREFFLTCNGKFPKKSALLQLSNPNKYCCICAEHGHFYTECSQNSEAPQNNNLIRHNDRRPRTSMARPINPQNHMAQPDRRFHNRSAQNMGRGTHPSKMKKKTVVIAGTRNASDSNNIIPNSYDQARSLSATSAMNSFEMSNASIRYGQPHLINTNNVMSNIGPLVDLAFISQVNTNPDVLNSYLGTYAPQGWPSQPQEDQANSNRFAQRDFTSLGGDAFVRVNGVSGTNNEITSSASTSGPNESSTEQSTKATPFSNFVSDRSENVSSADS